VQKSLLLFIFVSAVVKLRYFSVVCQDNSRECHRLCMPHNTTHRRV